MPIFDPGPLDEAAKRAVIREAESIMVANEDPKALLVRAALDHHTTTLGAEIAQKIAGVLQMHDMLSQPHDASLIEAIEAAMPDLVSHVGEPFRATLGEPEHIAGNVESIGYALAKASRAMFKEPIAANRGKWLSKIGIVAADIAAISPKPTEARDEAVFADAAVAAAPPAPPEIPPAAPAMSPEMMAMLGITGDAAPPPPPPVPEPLAPVSPDIPVLTPTPSAPGIIGASMAVQNFAKALSLKDDDFCKRLGISRGTLSNWHNGKTSREIKLSPEQARLYLAECDVRASMLRDAAQAFALLARG